MTARSLRALKFSTLLDQQLWFIGHDIRHADGNALTRFGFERWRSPAVGTSCYRLLGEAPTHHVVCWGFGIYVGPVHESTGCLPEALHQESFGRLRRGVFIQRHSATPRLLSAPLPLPLHQPSELPTLRSPFTADDWSDVRAGMGVLAGVLARYEAWAHDALGAAHRTNVLAMVPRHKRRRFRATTDLASLWSARAAAWPTAAAHSADVTH
ncbi:hypothetical protein [Gemmatimonas sp.]|jgi:hypothetical protein|uniref:hypothetical protein n=1 Tax=Gemmatimonas sp. TaxID=1962908 RepID=UPI0037BF9245